MCMTLKAVMAIDIFDHLDKHYSLDEFAARNDTGLHPSQHSEDSIRQEAKQMSTANKLTTAAGAPVTDNQNIQTAGPRGPALLQDVWLIEKLAHFDREVIPERRMHAKGSGAYGSFTVTNDISRYTRAKIFSKVGKKTELFARFTTVAGERGAADAERDIRGFAVKFYTEEGNWDLVGNNTPVFFLRDPLKFPDLNHAVKRDPRTNTCAAPATTGISGRRCPRHCTRSRS